MQPEVQGKGAGAPCRSIAVVPTPQLCQAAAENASATPASPDEQRQLAIACLLEAGRRIFAVKTIEAGSKKLRCYYRVFKLIVLGHLGFASPAAKFTSISELARMAGISRHTAPLAVDELIRLNVTHDAGRTRRPLLLCVNPNVESWLVPKTIEDDTWFRMLREWRQFCCAKQLELPLPDFGPADPTLCQLLALVNMDSAIAKARSAVGYPEWSTAENLAHCGPFEPSQVAHCGPSQVAHCGPSTAPHINDYIKRSFNRSTLIGKDAAWRYSLARLKEFLGKTGQKYCDDEMARAGGMWTILAKGEGPLLVRAIADLEDKERTESPSVDRARRLTYLVRTWLSPARWSELFSGPA